MSGEWQTQEDFERDLILYSDFPTEDNEVVKNVEVPKSIQRYREQMAVMSKYNQPEVDETATYIISGRGKGVPTRLVEPGKLVQHCHLDDLEIKKKLREVCGMGYSNEFIEEAFNRKTNSHNNSSSSSPELEFEEAGRRKSNGKMQISSKSSDTDESVFKDADFPELR